MADFQESAREDERRRGGKYRVRCQWAIYHADGRPSFLFTTRPAAEEHLRQWREQGSRPVPPGTYIARWNP
jgi:hypothetical protein